MALYNNNGSAVDQRRWESTYNSVSRYSFCRIQCSSHIILQHVDRMHIELTSCCSLSLSSSPVATTPIAGHREREPPTSIRIYMMHI